MALFSFKENEKKENEKETQIPFQLLDLKDSLVENKVRGK